VGAVDTSGVTATQYWAKLNARVKALKNKVDRSPNDDASHLHFIQNHM